MTVTKLKEVDWEKQKQRIADFVRRIDGRAEASKAGRIVAEDDDLLIGLGRRIDAGVLYLDLCKFSARASSTADEQREILWALSIYFAEFIRIIESYGGTVEKNTGDGLLAYFTSETLLDDTGPAKAAAAALTMFYAARHMIAGIVQARGVQPFDFRITIDSGPITVAKVGAPRSFNGIVAIGATANCAAKMLALAEANQILVGEWVVPLLPEEFRQHCKLIEKPFGWVAGADNHPYRVYHFDAHWIPFA